MVNILTQSMIRKLPGIILLASLGLLSLPADAIYRWLDDEGNVHYGDRVPAEYAQQERRVLNERGRTVKVYEAAKTPEEIADHERLEAIRAEEERAERARNKRQAAYDRSLLATYSNEKDMYQARDGRTSAVEALIQLTQSRIKSMNRRLATLNEEAADFERSGKKLPKSLAQQIANLQNQIRENKAFVITKDDEKITLGQKFEKDILRYRELHGAMKQ